MRKSLLLSIALFIPVLSAQAVSINPGGLPGGFGTDIEITIPAEPENELCHSEALESTLFVDSTTELPLRDGSYSNPFKYLGEAESLLKSESTYDTLCLKGEFNENLALNNLNTTNLSIEGYGLSTPKIGLSFPAVVQVIGDELLTSLSINNIYVEGEVDIKEIYSVNISNSEFNGFGKNVALKLHEIEELEVNNIQARGASDYGLQLYLTNNALIQNSYFTQNDEGIRAYTTEYLQIENSVFEDNVDRNIYIYGVTLSLLSHIESYGSEDGIYIGASGGDEAMLNQINVQGHQDTGIYLNEINQISLENTRVTGGEIGIKVNEVSQMNLNNSTLNGSTEENLQVDDSEKIYILNTDFSNSEIGLLVENTEHIKLINATISNMLKHGARLELVDNVEFENLIIKGTEDGIYIEANNTGETSLSKVNIEDYNDKGISIYGVEEINIEEVIITGGYTCLKVDEALSLNVDSSTLNECVNRHINIDESTDIQISNTNLLNGEWGITTEESQNLNLSNTTIDNMTRSGIEVETLNELHLDQVSISNIGSSAVKADFITDLNINNSEFNQVQYALYLYYAAESIVTNTQAFDIEDGLIWQSGENIQMENILIENAEDLGVFISNVETVDIENITLDRIGEHGLYLNETTNVSITNSSLSNVMRDGLFATYTNSLDLGNSSFESIGSSGASIQHIETGNIEGNTFSNITYNGLYLNLESAEVNILNNQISNHEREGIDIDSNGEAIVRIEQNIISENGKANEGVQAEGIKQISLINNVISDHREGFKIEAENIEMIHNTIYDSTGAIDELIADDVEIYNNIFYASAYIYNDVEVNTLNADYNIYYGTENIYDDESYDTDTQFEGWQEDFEVDENSYNEDPNISFDNPFLADGDYHLAPFSIAIDNGINLGVQYDVEGKPRDKGPDIGASEE